jgi:hypothetical protein
MTWIKVYQSVRDHRKVVALADALGVEEAHATGLLVNLWIWAVDNAPDGVLPESDRAVSRGAGWNMDPHAFVSGLVSAELVDTGDVGERRIHDWDYYTGNLIEHRKANVKRVQEWRSKNVTRNESVTKTNVTRTLQGESRVEKSREEKKRPSDVYMPDFSEFWNQWPKKGDARKPTNEKWNRMSKTEREAALAALPNWLPYFNSVQNRIIPNATTWLNQARWEVDPPPVERRPHSNGNGRVSLSEIVRQEQERSVIETKGRVL